LGSIRRNTLCRRSVGRGRLVAPTFPPVAIAIAIAILRAFAARIRRLAGRQFALALATPTTTATTTLAWRLGSAIHRRPGAFRHPGGGGSRRQQFCSFGVGGDRAQRRGCRRSLRPTLFIARRRVPARLIASGLIPTRLGLSPTVVLALALVTTGVAILSTT
jgi:hypothetical protein